MLTEEEIGKKIRDLRVKHGVAQADLAKAIGLESHAAISDIERGKTNLKVTQLSKIASFFKMTVEDLLNSRVITTHVTHHRESKDTTSEDRKQTLKEKDGFLKRLEEIKENKHE